MNISVVIPTFNRAHTLSRALHSVLKQTHPANEIILVDDGSTDHTQQLLEKEFPGILYLRQNNGGVSAARNKGIQSAAHEWIAFLDSDDEWQIDKLAKQVSALQNQPDILLCHTDEIWIRNGKRVNAMKKHRKTGGRIFQHCLPLCAISPSSVLMHRKLFDEIGLFDETLPACEDYDMWLRITAKYAVHYIEEALIIKYGGHADQLSRKHWGMDRFRIQALEKIINHGNLPADYQHAALQMLEEKLNIVMLGARKHGNQELLQCLSLKHRAYNKAFDNLRDAL